MRELKSSSGLGLHHRVDETQPGGERGAREKPRAQFGCDDLEGAMGWIGRHKIPGNSQEFESI